MLKIEQNKSKNKQDLFMNLTFNLKDGNKSQILI